MRLFLLACALYAGVQGVPAFAQGDAEDTYQRAVAARLGGDPALAAELLQTVVSAQPENADAQVQLGYALLSLNRLDEAERSFNSALAIVPTYADASMGLARIAERRGDNEAALRALDAISEPNAEIKALRQRLEQASRVVHWQADLDGSYSTFDRVLSDWQEVAVQLRHQSQSGNAIAGRIEYARRFDMDDLYGEILVERRLSSSARVYASFGATAAPDFRAKWQVGLGGSVRLHGGGYATVLTLDARQARFANGDVQSVSPGVEQYLGKLGWLTARWINLFDERGTRRTGYLVRGDIQALPALRLFAGASKAPDTDEGRVVQVKSLFGGIVHDIGPRTALRASISYDDRATGFDRTQFGLGVGVRF